MGHDIPAGSSGAGRVQSEVHGHAARARPRRPRPRARRRRFPGRLQPGGPAVTTRERHMSIFLIGFILVGGVGFFGYQFVLAPLKAKGDQLSRLTEENELREARIARIVKRRADEEKWKKLSLP